MVRYPSKKNIQTIKKWLPAIVAAIALHLLIIFLFLEKQDTASKSDADDSAPTSGYVQNDTDLTDATFHDVVLNGSEPDRLTTMTDSSNDPQDDVGDSEKENLANENTASQTALTGRDNSNGSTNHSSAKNASSVNNNKSLEDTSLGNMDSSYRDPNNHNQAPTSQLNKSSGQALITQSNNFDNGGNATTDNRPTSATDKRLLSMDTPNAPMSNRTDTNHKEYDQVAQEVEEINAKLSATINTVKQRNMQQIEARRAQEKAAYLKDQQAKLNEQLAIVSEQLGVDELAEAEFSNIEAE